MMKITRSFIIGSASKLKEDSVLDALRRLKIKGTVIRYSNFTSHINAQPIGMDEIIDGATTRAYRVAEFDKEAYCIGIENGIIITKVGSAIELAVIVVLNGNDRSCMWIGTSQSIQIPLSYVGEVLERGVDKTTIGMIVHEHFPRSKIHDPHSFLTKGLYSRRQLLADAAYTTFGRIFT